MSANSAPPRRSLNTSSTRFITSTLLDFMLADPGINPLCVPIMQGWVIHNGQVLAIAIGSQVTTSFKDQTQAILKCKCNNFGMASRRSNNLAASLHQLRHGAEVFLGVCLLHEITT